MIDPGEAAASIVLLFFGMGILLAMNATLYGGNVDGITNAISALAGPIVVVALLVFVALSILNMVSGR